LKLSAAVAWIGGISTQRPRQPYGAGAIELARDQLPLRRALILLDPGGERCQKLRAICAGTPEAVLHPRREVELHGSIAHAGTPDRRGSAHEVVDGAAVVDGPVGHAVPENELVAEGEEHAQIGRRIQQRATEGERLGVVRRIECQQIGGRVRGDPELHEPRRKSELRSRDGFS